MQITSEFRGSIKEKIKNFNLSIEKQSIILLVRPKKNIYLYENSRKKFEKDIGEIINKGLLNLEIPWEDNENWLDLMAGLKAKFPFINLGSASIKNKKSIDDSIKIGLNFSMMKFWEKDLFLYSRKKHYLLIPGLNKLEQFKEANSYNCKIMKIYPVKNKDKLLNLREFKNISFIAAGGICISDLNLFLKHDYKSIVIGERAYSGEFFDQEILKWLSINLNKEN